MDELKDAAHYLDAVGHSVHGTLDSPDLPLPTVRRVGLADLRDVLAKGLDDFGVFRTDVVLLCLLYPVIGIVLAGFASHHDMLPLLFPAVSGFALLCPLAAVGLYEMSRRREQGVKVNWADAFGVIRSPSFGAIVVLGLVMLGVFMLWLAAAQVIYWGTLGPEPPSSVTSFVRDVFTTGAGWVMMVVGVGVGFLFAVLVLAMTVVSFPLLLDRDVGLGIAVWTSIRVVAANPVSMAAWGLIIAGGLVLGTIPVFVGLIVVLPVLGHATWHLYRKAVQ